MWCALPLRAFYVVAFPLLQALDGATSLILRAIGAGGTTEHEAPHSQEELLDLVRRSRAHGELSPWEDRLVQAAFDFDDKLCRQIMVPRGEIVFLDLCAPFADVLREAKRSSHTRYPVCNGSLDQVVGIAHVKDLVGVPREGSFKLRSVLRPPKYVPETMLISRLLSHFRATRQHMALVVDEYGTVVGMVTLENVLEEIVGPMQDEFDHETPEVIPEGEGNFLVQGGASVTEVAAALGLTLPTESADTVGGLIVVELGRVPQQGDRVQIDEVVFEVVEVRKNRIATARIRNVNVNGGANVNGDRKSEDAPRSDPAGSEEQDREG